MCKLKLLMNRLLLTVFLGCHLMFLGTGNSAVVTLAQWADYNTFTSSFPRSAEVKDSSITTATASYSGLTPINNPTRSFWESTNTSSTVDVATAPYLSWTLGLSAPTSFFSFIFGGLYASDGTLMDLRSSKDNFATSLALFDPSNSTWTQDGKSISSVGTVSSPTIEFRAFVYNSNASGNNLYVSTAGGFSYAVQIRGEAVPEPSAGALLVMGLGGVIALRRCRRSAV
jgi:hypothetical protein